MKKLKLFLKKNWFLVGVFLIFALSAFFRFYQYEDRWGLAYDQAQFAILARYSVETFQLPLLGPFSSGGEWYWLVMLGTIIYPFSLIAPWVFLTFLTTVSVLLMIILGKEMVDKKFGLMVGLIMAVSTAQVAQSTNLTNQTPIIIFSTLSVIAALRYLQQKKLRYVFFQSLCIGVASAIHIQAVALAPFILFTFILGRVPLKIGIMLVFIGLFIPWIPVLIADSQNNFYNTLSMATYFSSDQAKVSYEVLGRRWLTFLGYFIPLSWARITGGSIIISYGIIILLIITIGKMLVKRTITREWLVIISSTMAMIAILRYIRTPLFDSFLIFLHPFIFLLTGIAIQNVFRYKKVIGIMSLVIILAGSMILSIKDIWGATNYTAKRAASWRGQLIEKYPTKKFAVYDFLNGTGSISLPLVLFLNEHGKIDDKGLKIGIVIATSGAEFQHPVISGDKTGYQVLNLDSSKSAELKQSGWVFINPSEIYNSTEGWYKK